MNERIKQIAVQAKVEHCVSHVRLKEFAELIIRECAKFLDENSGYDDTNNAWHPEPEDLLKHFGVEE